MEGGHDSGLALRQASYALSALPAYFFAALNAAQRFLAASEIRRLACAESRLRPRLTAAPRVPRCALIFFSIAIAS